jgi:hypothetical protein
MGACFSVEKGKFSTDGKCQSLKSRKGRGKTVTPVPGTPLTNTKKGEINRFRHCSAEANGFRHSSAETYEFRHSSAETNGFRHSSAETTIHNLLHLSSDRSVTAHSKPEVTSVNLHVNEVEKGHTRTDSYAGSKEETFFDSVAVLESDCDEDFLSVNGDFSLSAGNTWNHPNSTQGTPRPSIASLKDRMTKLEDLSGNKSTLIAVQNEGKEGDFIVIEDIPRRQRKMKLKEFFMEKSSNEDDTVGLDHSIYLDPRANGVPGSKDDYNAATDGKYALSKGPGGNSNLLIDTAEDNEKNKSHNQHERQISKCCLPRPVMNVGFSEKRRSSSSNHNPKEEKKN